MVTFEVDKGDRFRKFLVYRELACYYSPVWNSAFANGFKEGESQTYKLDDVSASVFELLVQWLNTQKFDGLLTQKDVLEAKKEHDTLLRKRKGTSHKKLKLDLKKSLDPSTAKQLKRNLIDLWILADKFIIPKLQKLAILALARAGYRYGPVGATEILHAYKNTLTRSELRRHLVTSSVGNCDKLEEILKELKADADSADDKAIHFEVSMDLNAAQQRRREECRIYCDDGSSEMGCGCEHCRDVSSDDDDLPPSVVDSETENSSESE